MDCRRTWMRMVSQHHQLVVQISPTTTIMPIEITRTMRTIKIPIRIHCWAYEIDCSMRCSSKSLWPMHKQCHGELLNYLSGDKKLHSFISLIAFVICRPVRRTIEFFFLLKALIAFFILVYIHITFSQTPSTCLEQIRDGWPRDGVLRYDLCLEHFQFDCL